jgi:hypothetical protein
LRLRFLAQVLEEWYKARGYNLVLRACEDFAYDLAQAASLLFKGSYGFRQQIHLLKASLSIALGVSSIPWITMTVHCGRPVGFPGLARLYQRLPRLSQLFMIDIQQELLGKLDTGGVKRAPTWHLRALAKVKG